MHIVVRDVEFDTVGDDRNWKSVADGRYEPYTFEIFDRYIRSDRPYIDLGVWIGSTVLYGASKAKHCFCADPNPITNRKFLGNLALNDNLKDKVTLFNGCVSNVNGNVRFGLPHHSGASSMIFPVGCKSIIVKSVTLERFIEMVNAKDFNFIKMDVEGAETLIIPSSVDLLKLWRPVLYLSFHILNFPDKVGGINAIVDSLSFYKNIYAWGRDRISPEELKSKLIESLDHAENSKWHKYHMFECVFTDLDNEMCHGK